MPRIGTGRHNYSALRTRAVARTGRLLSPRSVSGPLAAFRAASEGVIDLVSTLRFQNTVPHPYTKFRQLKAIAAVAGADILIESGTYLGMTARRAAHCFSHVYTIELDGALASAAKARLSKLKNVTVVQGDSTEVLPGLMGKAEIDNALVFLDGHYSGGSTALGPVVEPAILELEVLAPFRDRLVAVVIDDFRTFGESEGVPMKSELFNAIERLFPEFRAGVNLDQVLVSRR